MNFLQLEACSDYETRRKIRARLRIIMADQKRKNTNSLNKVIIINYPNEAPEIFLFLYSIRRRNSIKKQRYKWNSKGG
jgi:hypothetical protein